MAIREISGLGALALVLGAIMNESIPDDRKEMTEEHHAKFDAWLAIAATGDIDAIQAMCREIDAFHDADDTHDYKGLCGRILDFGHVLAELVTFRFGPNAIEELKAKLQANVDAATSPVTETTTE